MSWAKVDEKAAEVYVKSGLPGNRTKANPVFLVGQTVEDAVAIVVSRHGYDVSRVSLSPAAIMGAMAH